jgi:hypothetical protein
MEKFYLKIFYFLLFFLFLVILKYCVDFYILNRAMRNKYKESIDKKIILNPRIQTYNKGYNFIVAKDGIAFDGGDYIFYDVKVSGDSLSGTADELHITENKNIFEFKKNVVFIINN